MEGIAVAVEGIAAAVEGEVTSCAVNFQNCFAQRDGR